MIRSSTVEFKLGARIRLVSNSHLILRLVMAPKKQLKKEKAGVSSETKAYPPIVFPEITEKEDLGCFTVLEDQILIVDVCNPPLAFLSLA
jgi:hypothetical protein